MKIIAKRILGDLPDIDLADGYFVEFGDGSERIAVGVRNGAVEISTVSGMPLLIEPRAANLVRATARWPR
jgi:hypothetical protein